MSRSTGVSGPRVGEQAASGSAVVPDLHAAEKALPRTAVVPADGEALLANSTSRRSRAPGSDRPSPRGPHEPPEGHEWFWGLDPEWRAPAPEGRLCRWRGHGQVCEREAVALLNRPMRRFGRSFDVWWSYCPDHLYGRRIVGDRVEVLRLRKIPSEVRA